MAIAFGSLLGQVDTGVDATSFATTSFTPEASALLVAAVHWNRASLGNDPTFSGGGLTWSACLDRVGFDTVASPSKWLGWAWAVAPGSPSSMTVTADFAGQSQIGCSVHVFSLTGAHATAPRVQAKTAAADNVAASLTATLDGALAAGSATIVIGGQGPTDNPIDPRASWTEASDTGHANPGARLETQYRLATSETTGGVATTAGTPEMALIIVEIALASTGSSAITPTTRALAFSRLAPTVQSGSGVSRTPTVGALALSRLAPTVTVSSSGVTRTPLAGALSLAGSIPVVLATAPLSPSTELATVWLVDLMQNPPNAGMETWDSPAAPTGWGVFGAGASAAKNITAGQVHGGSASASLTRAGTDCVLFYNLEAAANRPLTWWAGRTIVVQMWVRATVADRAYVNADDGTTFVGSRTHTGGGEFELLTLTLPIGAAPTRVLIGLTVAGGNTTAQVDDVSVFLHCFSSVDLDALPVQYIGALLNEPTVSRSLSGVRFGFVVVQDVTLVFDNTAGALTAAYLADLAGTPMVIRRYDRVSGVVVVVWVGVVASARLSRETLEVRGSAVNRAALETSVPRGLVDLVTFPGARDVVGATVPWQFGNHRNLPVLNVNDGQGLDRYDYAASRGLLAGITGARRVGGEGEIPGTSLTYEIEFDELEPYPGMDGVLINGNIEDWDAGAAVAPDSWVLDGAGATVAKNITAGQFDEGSASASLTATVTVARLTQNLVANAPSLPLSWWQGRQLFVTVRARATVASRAFLRITDGFVTEDSTFHTGGGAFETLAVGAVSYVVNAAATSVTISVRVEGGATTAQFDDVRVYLKAKNWAETLRPDLYAGYTALRFFDRQTDINGAFYTIAIDANGLQPERNPVRAARTILSDPALGAGHAVNAVSFDAAEIATTKTYDAAVLLDAAQAYLPFRDPIENRELGLPSTVADDVTWAGGVARDHSGYGRHARAAIADPAAYTCVTPFGPSLHFPDAFIDAGAGGTSRAYFEIPYDVRPGFDSADACVLEQWYYIDGTVVTGTQPICEKRIGTTGAAATRKTGRWLSHESSGIQFGVMANGGTAYTCSAALTAGTHTKKWLYLVGVAADGVLSLYRGYYNPLSSVDVVPPALVASGTYVGSLDTGDGLTVIAGSSGGGAVNWYSHFGMYSTPLTLARIVAHHAAILLDREPVVTTYDQEITDIQAPALYFMGAENLGQTVMRDDSGNNNHGTWVGGPTLGPTVPGPLPAARGYVVGSTAVRFANDVTKYGVKTGETLANSALAIQFWYRPAVHNAKAGVFEKCIGTGAAAARDTQWGVCQRGTNLRWTLVTTAGVYTVDMPLTAEDVGRWGWYSVDYKNSTLTMRIYKNGLLAASGLYTGSAVSGVGDFLIGVQGTVAGVRTRPGQGDLGRISCILGGFVDASIIPRIWVAATWYNGGLYVDFAMTEQRQVRDWLNPLFELCGARLDADADGAITIEVDAAQPASALALHDGEGDGAHNLLACRDRHRPDLIDRVKDLRFSYRYDPLTDTYLRTRVIAVSAEGTDFEVKSRVVREDPAADRGGGYIAGRLLDDETAEIEFVQAADELVLEGDGLTVTDAAAGYAAADLEVLSVDIDLDSARAAVGALSGTRYLYVAHAFDADSNPE